jgi:hypothetical protein
MNPKFYITYILTIILSPHISFAQNPYHPFRIKNNITLDGKFLEPEWQQAEVETDFMQYDPTAGAEPTEKSEVRMLYNDSYLFVGLRAYDHHPEKLVRYSLQRDFDLGNDDGPAFAIDMYNDKSTGLGFIVNLLGARWDAELSADGVNLNDSYNTFWDVTSSIDSLGYTTEYRIPFSSLRFETKDTVRMGFRMVRLIKRLNEFDIYPRCDPHIEDAYFKISLGREMEFYKLKSRKPFYITPYVIANYSAENILNTAGTAYERHSAYLTQKHYAKNKVVDKALSNIGCDIKYGLTKNFTLDATLNTDFAQAEADNVIVNLTKYEVNLPEKRNFFLESQNYLSYTTSTGNELFISRSIGLEDNTIVPIIGGIRLTGKTHGWQMGLLDMETKKLDDPAINSHNIFVFRTRKDIDGIGSFAGGIITNTINTSGNDSSAQSFGLGIVKKLNAQVTTIASVSGTTINGSFKNIHQQMDCNAGIFRTARQGWYYGTDIDWIGKNFSPALGYVQENDLLYVRGDIGYKWQAKEESKMAYYYLHTNLRYKWKPNLEEEETKFINAEAGVGFKNGAAIDITPFEYQTDVVLEDWHLTDHITIPMGKYKMFSPDINFTTPQKSKYHGSLFIKFLDFYGGKRLTLSPNLTYIFSKHLFATVEYEYDRIKFPNDFSDNGNSLFQSNLTRLILSYYFSIRFSVKLLSQYDKLNKMFSSNLRIRYNPREGTDLYIVFNQGLNNDRARLNPHLPFVSNEAVIIKFLKTFIL